MEYRYPQLHNVKWLKEEIQTKSLRRIAKELGCHNSAVMWAIKKYGIKIPYRKTHYYVNGSSWNKGMKGIFVGEKASHWKGGRIYFRGYIYIHNPTHPYATKKGYVFEHRLIIEKAIERMLTPKEIVHHINGIKDDNRLENLQLMESHEDNTKLHFQSHKENILLKQELAKYKEKFGEID